MKNNVILTFVIAFLMFSQSVSAIGFTVKPNANFKNAKSASVNKDDRKVSKKVTHILKSKGEKKDEVTFVQCCVKSNFSFTDAQGFCCTEVSIESCASNNDCDRASRQNVAILTILMYMGMV